jgi:hypothetical protein
MCKGAVVTWSEVIYRSLLGGGGWGRLRELSVWIPGVWANIRTMHLPSTRGLAVYSIFTTKVMCLWGRMLDTKRRHNFLWASTDVLQLEVICEGIYSSAPFRTHCRLKVASCCRISVFTSDSSHLKNHPSSCRILEFSNRASAARFFHIHRRYFRYAGSSRKAWRFLS